MLCFKCARGSKQQPPVPSSKQHAAITSGLQLELRCQVLEIRRANYQLMRSTHTKNAKQPRQQRHDVHRTKSYSRDV